MGRGRGSHMQCRARLPLTHAPHTPPRPRRHAPRRSSTSARPSSGPRRTGAPLRPSALRPPCARSSRYMGCTGCTWAAWGACCLTCARTVALRAPARPAGGAAFGRRWAAPVKSPGIATQLPPAPPPAAGSALALCHPRPNPSLYRCLAVPPVPQRWFLLVDEDRSGALDMKELAQALRAAGLPCSVSDLASMLGQMVRRLLGNQQGLRLYTMCGTKRYNVGPRHATPPMVPPAPPAFQAPVPPVSCRIQTAMAASPWKSLNSS